MTFACSFSLKYTTLQGLCVAPNGKFYLSQIDLNDHYANIRGSFESGDRHFASTGRNFHLQLTSSALNLLGELQDGDHIFRSAQVDLSICIVNQSGRLTFVKQYVHNLIIPAIKEISTNAKLSSDSFLDRDGWLTRFLERLPLIGFVVSGIQLLAGNEVRQTKQRTT